MDFDDQLRRHFGTDNLASLTPDALASGIEHLQVELGLETDLGRRFATWSLLYILGASPALDVAFADESEREAARNFMDLLDRAAVADDGAED